MNKKIQQVNLLFKYILGLIQQLANYFPHSPEGLQIPTCMIISIHCTNREPTELTNKTNKTRNPSSKSSSACFIESGL